VEALLAISYGVKFAASRGAGGIRLRSDALGRVVVGRRHVEVLARPQVELELTATIMQPDVVTDELVQRSISEASKKKRLPATTRLRLDRFGEGRAAQVLHMGPYSAERPTIERLHAFIAEAGHRPRGKHHEIYLSDPSRAEPVKLKTIVRQPIAAAS
jgi:hypothetical protein